MIKRMMFGGLVGLLWNNITIRQPLRPWRASDCFPPRKPKQDGRLEHNQCQARGQLEARGRRIRTLDGLCLKCRQVRLHHLHPACAWRQAQFHFGAARGVSHDGDDLLAAVGSPMKGAAVIGNQSRLHHQGRGFGRF